MYNNDIIGMYQYQPTTETEWVNDMLVSRWVFIQIVILAGYNHTHITKKRLSQSSKSNHKLEVTHGSSKTK